MVHVCVRERPECVSLAYCTDGICSPVGLSTYFPSSCRPLLVPRNRMCFLIGIIVLTEPEIGPSCADLPLTLNVTPFGAFDLTSRFAGGMLEAGIACRRLY